jgi:hypothetical protein
MKQGFFGITWPNPNVAVELLFGLYRGLLPLSPVLVLVPVGLYVMRREQRTRVAAGAIVFVICSFLWINASYYYWDGGWSTGPRHLVPMLPLCCVALAFAWPRAFWARRVTLVLLAASLVLSLICAEAGMFAPSGIRIPLIEFLLPIFLTPEKLLQSLLIVLVWLAFGLLFLRVAPDVQRHQRVLQRHRSEVDAVPAISAHCFASIEHGPTSGCGHEPEPHGLRSRL